MLSALYRLFRASPASNPEDDQASIESTREDPRVNGSVRATINPDDSGLGMDTARLQRRPSVDANAIMDARRRAPSHVSWKTTPNTNPSPSPISDSIWGSQYESQSASAPSLLLLNPGSAHKAASIHRPSSQSLRAPSVAASEDVSRRNSPDKRENIELHPIKQLSAIDPRVRLPGGRRPSTDSIPLTPDSTRVHDGHLAAYPGAFINRPLNRSVSQTSTSTTASVTPQPPTIPPLDLRPDFQKTIGSPIRKSRLPPPTLPTVLGSPHPAQYSIIYEDGSSARSSKSFVTAPSAHDASTPEPDVGREHEHAEAHTVYARDYAVSNASSLDVTPAVRTSGLPEGLYDIDLGGPSHAGTSTRPPSINAASSRLTQPLLHAPPSALPRRPRARSPSPSTDTELYIYNRWLRGVSFGSGNYEFHIPRVLSRRKTRTRLGRFVTDKLHMGMTSACVLFWVGFVGPWCWLVGGWMLTTEGELEPEFKHADPILPLWSQAVKLGAVKDKGKAPLAPRLYPLVAPSVESLTPSTHSRASVVTTPRVKKETDIWVIRCRIAAIMSGTLLLAAVIVAVIVAASRY